MNYKGTKKLNMIKSHHLNEICIPREWTIYIYICVCVCVCVNGKR